MGAIDRGGGFWGARLKVLGERLRTAPLFGALVAMVLGVVCGTFCVAVPPYAWIVAAVVFCVMAWLGRRRGRFLTLYTALAVMFFGAALARAHTPHAVVPRGERVWLDVRLGEDLTLRGGSFRGAGFALNWRREGGEWQRTGEKLVVGIDTAWHAEGASRVIFRGYVGAITDSVSSYSRLMKARGYSGRTYVSRWSRPRFSSDEKRAGFARRLQEGAAARLAKLAKLNQTEDPAIAVAAAMTVGDRGGITPEIRRAYARTGASHLLAVSGLHVGIVFGLVNLLLLLLPMARGGHIAKNIVAIALVWLYATLTGLSPSAVRAAFMFSGAQVALASSRDRSPANIMSGVALVMLAVRPGLLFDISFQLSFIAVAAIMAWFGPLYRLVESGRRSLDAVGAMVIMGVVATVATMPLVSHTFGVISPLGALLGPLLIVVAHAVVFFSLVWIVAPVPFLEPVLRWLVGGVAGFQNGVVELAAGIPAFGVEWTMPLGGVVGSYAAIVALTVWLYSWPGPREPVEFVPPREPVDLTL